MKLNFSFREYLFPEKFSSIGMIAPSVMIYLLHTIFTKNVSKSFKFIVFLFILVCLIKSSTTLLIGTILSLILIIFVNFKFILQNNIVCFWFYYNYFFFYFDFE